MTSPAPPAIRLFHPGSKRHFIVAGTAVYADRNRAGRIRSGDRMDEPLDGVTPGELLEAAAYFRKCYEIPIADTPTLDRSILSAGLVNAAEVRRLERDPAGVPAVRTPLERHLDFFDSETFDGRITLGENWRGWRRLGYGYFKALIGTLGAALVFGRLGDRLAIDIARIAEKRRRTVSGLYDSQGHVNGPLLEEYLEAFRQRASNGVVSQDEATAIIESRASLGRVSKRQFKSLFGLCTRLNRNQKVITEQQFAALFDGSLLYLAASTPDAHGRRGLMQEPSGAPLIIKVAAIAMAVIYAPRPVWQHPGGWLLVAASWLLYALLASRTSVERSVVLVVGVLAATSVWSSLSWGEWLAVWPFILVTAALALGQQWRPVLQYVFYLRFPLLLALTTMLLPVIAVQGAPLLFKSLFMLEWGGLMVVVMLAVLVAKVSLASALVIARDAARRFGARAWPAPADLIVRRGSWFALLTALPVIVSLVWLSESSPVATAAAVAGGLALALALERLARRLGRRPPALAGVVRQAVARGLARLEGPASGYLDDRGRLQPGHLANAGLMLVTVALYAAGYVVLKPASPVHAPAIAFVLFMLIILGWFLPAVSFFADKYRVSTFVALAVVPYVLYFINDIDHYYQVPARMAASAPAVGSAGRDLRTAFDNRMARARALYPDAEPVMIAVAAGGGGGSAALWSARVLAGLQQQFGARFTDSIHVVSGVSGGGIGAMYFVSMFVPPGAGDRGRAPSDWRLDDAVRSTGRSTLSSVAWGLAYPDFWRLFSLRHWNPYVDRGWALEEALDAQLGASRGVRLSQWRDGVLEGWRPALLFNATVSETGDRLVISPLRLRRASEACRAPDAPESGDCEDQIDAETLGSLHPSVPDLRVATAARLSSTFPFVLPIPKPPRAADGAVGYHLADGGYYDNNGLLTLVEWARKALAFSASSPARKLLLIDIRVPDPVPGPRDRAGWVYSTAGPVLTMFRARGTSQVRRNLVDVDLLSNLRQAGGFTIRRVAFPMLLQTSRSYHLPASEREAIEAYWNSDAGVLRARGEVCDFLGPEEWNCASPLTGSP